MLVEPERGHFAKRILMTADAVGGVWQYSLDLIRGLSRGGAEVMLAVLGPPPSDDQLNEAQSIKGLKLVAGNYPLEWMPEPWQGVDECGEWLLRLQDLCKPDLIHLNGYSLASLPWRAPVIVVAHSCVYSWWEAVHQCEPPAEWATYSQRVKLGLEACSAIVAPSSAMAQSLVRHYAADRAKLRVIYNFSGHHSSELSADNEPSKDAFAHKKEFLLGAGRLWDRAKNLALLASAARDVDWPIAVAGSEPEGLHDSFSSLRLLGRLAHTELLAHMRSAGIFVHPALYEPFGLSVLEAAQQQCCLLLSDIPSLRELWEGAAVFVDPRDPAAWVAAAKRLIANPHERAGLARAASLRARRFNSEAAVSAYQSLYAELLLKAEQEAAA